MAKRQNAKKSVPAKKAAAKKTAAKKSSAKKATAASKKSTQKAATKKSAVPKAAPKKAAASKAPAKKAAARKTSARKVTTKKATSARAATKKAASKKAPVSKSAAATKAAQKAASKKPAVKKKTATRKPASKKAAAARQPAGTTQKPARDGVRRPVAKGAQARSVVTSRGPDAGKTPSGAKRSRGRLFKSLGKKLEEQRAEILDLYRNDLGQGQAVSHDGDDDVDRANHDSNRELALAISTGERETLQLISEALDRLKDGSYGDCTNCSRVIADVRLEAIPWARHCVDCQELQERGLLET